MSNNKKKRGGYFRRPVVCWPAEGGEVLHFDSIKAAAQYVGANIGDISRLCQGVRGHKTCKGYVFRYDEGATAPPRECAEVSPVRPTTRRRARVYTTHPDTDCMPWPLIYYRLGLVPECKKYK